MFLDFLQGVYMSNILSNNECNKELSDFINELKVNRAVQHNQIRLMVKFKVDRYATGSIHMVFEKIWYFKNYLKIVLVCVTEY